MAQTTAIEWTDLSWNPVHGCSKVSPGCAHCYAETLSRRYKQTLKPWTPANAAENVQLKPHKLREPLSGAKDWQGLGAAAARAGMKRGKLVFVNSTSDLFHELVPDEFIAQVFATMLRAGALKGHHFQILTKRPERMRDVLRDRDFWAHVFRLAKDLPGGHECSAPVLYRNAQWMLENVWLGVSIENRRFVGRADVLRDTPADVRFISAEPLLGPLVASDKGEQRTDYGTGREGYAYWEDGRAVDDEHPELSLTAIDWLIVGGESGAGHRPIRTEWVRDLRDACLVQARWRDIRDRRSGPRPAFLFKQWGGPTSKSGGRELDGRTWDEFPQATATAGVFE